MRQKLLVLAAVAALAAFPFQAMAGTSLRGTASTYAVLAGTTVTNTGSTTIIDGHVGLDPGTALTGFSSVTFATNHTTQVNNAAAITAKADLVTAYTTLAALGGATDLTGQDLGGLTLTAGVYKFSSSAQLTGALTLDYQGDPDAVFVFQIGSTLTTASASSVVTINAGASDVVGCRVFWQVGSSATLGATTAFQGHILALSSITLGNSATIVGSALARNGAVTMDTNTITNTSCDNPSFEIGALVPLPPSAGLVLGLLPVFACILLRRRIRQRREFGAV